MDGQIFRLGSSGQALPVSSGQAQGQHDGMDGQVSHKGSGAQAPLECSSRQATAIIAICSTPSPEWSTQALPVGSSRPPSRVGQSDASGPPSPYSPRGAGSMSSTMSYRPTPKEKLQPRTSSYGMIPAFDTSLT